MAHPLQENGDNTVVGNGGGLAQLAMSMVGGGGGAPVPDILLSLAKDDRYISKVSSLLSQVVVPFASICLLPRQRGIDGRTRNGASSSSVSTLRENYDGDEILEDDGQRFIDRIRPELNLLASIIVHSATFIFYARNFGDNLTEVNNGESIKRTLGMESMNLAYGYPVRKRSESASSRATLIKSQRNHTIINRLGGYLVRIIASCKVSSWYRLLFLQTMVPYIIQRVGRGGWSKDLGGLLSALLDRFGLRPISSGNVRLRTINNRSENELMREEDINAVRNDDRLRGSARRRLFDEQRRRMQISSSSINDGDSEAGSERLGGGNIIYGVRHESNRDNENDQTTILRPSGNRAFGRRLERISTLSWTAVSKISHAVSSLSHGAHSLPIHTSVATAGENLDRYAKAIKWFLRLHLALFYWNGMYPTVAHRLAGAKIRDDVAPYSTGSSLSPMSGAIVANRPSYKPIAVIILFQAFAGLAQTTAEASIELAHFIQISFFRWRRRRRMQQQSIGSYTVDEHSSSLNRINSERAEYMDLIEERVPGINSSRKDAMKRGHKSRAKKEKQREQGESDTQPCGICLNERVHPAAPSVCGHVFCWNCILHWVSNVRAECPLCRGQTRPQDIIPLYNYP